MSKVPWTRVRPILEEVLDLPSEERAPRTRELCGGDAELESEVLRMVDLEDRPTRPKEEVILEGTAFQRLLGQEVAPGPGSELGDFLIHDEIGSGGMGRVYRATQKNLGRSVALKVLAPGMASQHHLERFQDEVQFLARLKHPGIAQVHRAGVWNDAQGNAWPYFAMEFVEDAQTLVQYATSSSTGVEDLLRLFAEVCEAVHHGHTKGVLHRDLKPGNILVDGQGQAKVIDYGVARAMDLEEASDLTRTGEIVGTIQYMSPEQVQGQPLGVASDVYSLGVVFYECLCGRSPYGSAEMDLPAKALAIIRQSPTRPGLLEPRLRGDLEWVLLQALEKEPERRYASALALAEDLRRYLVDQPLQAGPPSATYRLRKFVARNRVAVSSALVVVLGLGAGLAISVSKSLEAQQERLRRAEEEIRRLNARDSLLTSIQSLAPTEGVAVQVEDLLEAASQQGADSFDDDAGAEIEFRMAIARSFYRLGLYERSLEEARRALELAEGFSPAEDLGRVQLEILAAESLLNLGEPEVALTAAEELFEATRAAAGDGTQATETARGFLARMLMNVAGDLELAEEELRRAIVSLKELLGPDDLQVLEAEQDLAFCLNRSGYGEQSLALYASVRERLTRTRGPADHETIMCGFGEASTLLAEGRADEAVALTAAALEATARELKPDHPLRLYQRAALANYTLYAGRPQEATELLRDCLEPMTRVLGPHHPETLKVRGNLGNALLAQGDVASALPILRQAHEDAGAALDALSPARLPFAMDLGKALVESGNYEEGLPILEETVALGTELYGEGHPENLQLQLYLGERYGKSQALQRALDKAELVEAVLRAQPAPEPYLLGGALLLKGKCLVVMRRPVEAGPLLEQARDLFIELYGPEDSVTLEAVRFLEYTQR